MLQCLIRSDVTYTANGGMGSEWAMGWFRDGEIAKQQTCKLVAFAVLNSDDISTQILQCTSFAVMPCNTYHATMHLSALKIETQKTVERNVRSLIVESSVVVLAKESRSDHR